MLSSIQPTRDLRARSSYKARSQAIELPVVQPDASRVAVLLNRNARRVNEGLARKLERIVGRENLFFSGSLEEAEGYAREIVQRGYGTVVCGGGDGTFVRTVNMVLRYVEESNAWRTQRHRRFGERQTLLGRPRFALLRLGTGNAIGSLVGADDPGEDLRTLVDYVPARTQSIPMIEVDGERFFFAGMGYDAAILNDYNWLKAHTHNPLIKPMLHSVTGYMAALFSRTLPRIVAGQHGEMHVRVRAEGPAYRMDPANDEHLTELPAGSLLFEGPASFVGMGTTPYYGYGFKIFPFAGKRPGTMHLRVATLGALGCLAKLPSLWNGTLRDPSAIHDFLATKVSIELQQPFAFQHSGEACGERQSLTASVLEHPLEIVDFSERRS